MSQLCFNSIKQAFGDKLSDAEIKSIMSEVEKQLKAKKAANKLENLDAEVNAQLSSMSQNTVIAHIIEKRNAAINAITELKILRYVAEFGDDPATGLKSYLGGTTKLAKGSRLSIDARGKAITNEFLGKFINDLEKAGHMELFNSGALDKQIAAELWEIRPDGNPGISGSTQAKEIAEIIHKYQSAMVNRQNRAGSWIKALPGYIIRQSHSLDKIRKAGYTAWKQAILPLLDHEKTFGAEADVEAFLKGVYDGLASGMHKRVNAESSADYAGFTFGFTGPSNLAKKLSQQRILHFADSDAFMKYNELFGVGNIRESIIGGFEHGARNIALMEGLGTNPLAMIENITKKLKERYRDNPKVFDSLNSNYIRNLYKELDGSTRIPGNPTHAKIVAGIMMVQNMAKLGSAVVSSISDIPFQAAELRFQGESFLGGYANAFHNILRGRGDAEQKEIARLVGVGFEGFIGDIVSRFDMGDSLPGRMSKLQQRFFKLNGMSWWNDAHKTGVGLIMANNLAHKADNTFATLDVDTKRIFSMYDIGEREWEVFRTKAYEAPNGYKYLTPDKIGEMSDEEIRAYLGNPDASESLVAKTRDDLETKFRAYFIDRVDHAVPHPGAAERAMLLQGTSPGTAIGSALRLFAQFKSFPVTAMHKGVGRELFGKGANTFKEALLQGKGDMLGLVHMMVGTTIFGYMAMIAKDTLKGRSPRDPSDPKTVAAAMAQGGGMGIYGDFMFGEFSRYGRSALATAAGPTLGQIDDVAEMYTRLRTGQDTKANALRLAMNNTPFINLFYTRTALDYMFIYQLQETMNPGYLRRMEARIKSENDQKMYLPPSRRIPRGGGNKLFEGVL